MPFLFTFMVSENLEAERSEKIYFFRFQTKLTKILAKQISFCFLKRNWRTLPLSVAETVIGCKDWGRKKAWQNTHSKYTWYTLEVVGVVTRMFILELKKRQRAHNHEYTLLHCIWLNNGHFSWFQIRKVFGQFVSEDCFWRGQHRRFFDSKKDLYWRELIWIIMSCSKCL